MKYTTKDLMKLSRLLDAVHEQLSSRPPKFSPENTIKIKDDLQNGSTALRAIANSLRSQE